MIPNSSSPLVLPAPLTMLLSMQSLSHLVPAFSLVAAHDCARPLKKRPIGPQIPFWELSIFFSPCLSPTVAVGLTTSTLHTTFK